MVYDRKIKYLDYMENGERIKGGGFAKLEIRDKSLRLELNVTGLHPTDTFTRDVMLRSRKGEKNIGRIEISGGKGKFQHLCHDSDNICGTEISYEELQGLCIPLGTGREISCSWQGQRMADRETALPNKKDMSIPDAKETGFQDERAAELREVKAMEIPAEKTADIQGRKGMDIPGEKITDIQSRKGTDISGEKITDIQSRRETDIQGEKAVDIRSRKRTDVQRERTAVIQNTEDMNDPYKQEVHIRKQQETARKVSASDSAPVRRDVQTASISEWRRQDREGKTQERERTQVSQWNLHRSAETLPDSTEEWKMEENRKQREKTRAPINLMEDKWSQLWAIYPHIRPFRDEREYLSIGPADFVLFPSASYKMVNNSFLLHGYYNYNHLLLARLERKDEILYYIGVPGSFFEKEKQVAIMFGFESFECAEEPAQAGDFGYYMMRTEL